MENNVKGVFMYQGIHTTSQVDNIKEYFESLMFLIESQLKESKISGKVIKMANS